MPKGEMLGRLESDLVNWALAAAYPWVNHCPLVNEC